MRRTKRFAPARAANRRVLFEGLESRLLMTSGVSLLGQLTLPGANSTWDYSQGPFYPSAAILAGS